MALDFAVTYASDNQTLVLHRADCPTVRKLAAAGEPVLTLFACEKMPDDEMKKHSCLQAQ